MDDPQNQKAAPAADSAAESAGPGKRPFLRRPVVIVLGTLILGAGLVLGLGYLADTFTHESTDDAFLDATFASIAPKVAGRVQQVHVQDNQPVKAGELLVEIEPQDLQVALEQKKAAVKSAQANVELIKASLDLFRSEIVAAEATAKQTAAEAAAANATTVKAQTDLKRSEELIANHTISPQEYDSSKAAATWADANYKAAQQKAASDESKVEQSRAQLEAGVKGYERAQAQTIQAELEAQTAELNLSYTRLSAPADGFITKKAVEKGDYVQVGQRLMALVPSALFVTANFKETQLQNIRTNQSVQVRIDAVPDRTFQGHVESIQAGSGARFSLLPPENAVGNFVKVVQRIPVKIVFDEALVAGHVLGPGESVVPSVKVKGWEPPEVLLVLVAGLVALVVGVLWWRATWSG